MPYRIAGIDVHKKMLAVVVSDVEIESEFQFERRMFGSNPEQLRSLAAWLLEQEVEEVVMESGIDFEFCARCGAASVADGNAQEVPVEVRSGAAAEPRGGSSGRGPH